MRGLYGLAKGAVFCALAASLVTQRFKAVPSRPWLSC
jgi:hypothetical protein